MICESKHEYWRVQALMQRLRKLPGSAYTFVVKINVHNVLIMKEAVPPSVFDFWDVGEA